MNELAGDLFGTKGLEYILVIGYLLLLVFCWRFVRPKAASEAASANGESGRYPLPDGYHFHPGHTWASPLDEDRMRVGMDALAADVLGAVTAVDLPSVGATVRAGQPAWTVAVDGRRIPILSPVDGEVVARNDRLLEAPEMVTRAPYGDGWVLEVRVPDAAAATRNLLSGPVARAWRRAVVRQLDGVMGNGADPVGAATDTDWTTVTRVLLRSDGLEGQADAAGDTRSMDRKKPQNA